MTYFAPFLSSLKQHNLKIAIVFKYDTFRFEAWLAAGNRKVQRQYWELFKDGQWPAYRVSTPGKGVDSILECDLASDFDLDDPDALTSIIETTTLAFIDDIEELDTTLGRLSRLPDRCCTQSGGPKNGLASACRQSSPRPDPEPQNL